MGEWPTRTTANGAVVLRPEGRLNMVAALNYENSCTVSSGR